MSLIGNLLWLIFGGFVAAIGYILGGILLCITVIGLPFGIPAINLGFAVLMPFGKQVVATHQNMNLVALLLNILWVVVVGWAIAIAHLVHGIVLCVTVIGIPFGLQHFKLIPVALMPFSYTLA